MTESEWPTRKPCIGRRMHSAIQGVRMSSGRDDLKHRTSNLEHPAPNLARPCLVGRSVFDVRRWMFWLRLSRVVNPPGQTIRCRDRFDGESPTIPT